MKNAHASFTYYLSEFPRATQCHLRMLQFLGKLKCDAKALTKAKRFGNTCSRHLLALNLASVPRFKLVQTN